MAELQRAKAERLNRVVEQKEEHIAYLKNEHAEEVSWLETKIKKAKEEEGKENEQRIEHMRAHLMEMYVELLPLQCDSTLTDCTLSGTTLLWRSCVSNMLPKWQT